MTSHSNRRSRVQLWNAVESLAGQHSDRIVALLAPEGSRREPTEASEWWENDADQSQYTVTVENGAPTRERVPMPDFYPERGVVVALPSGRAACYAQYTKEHRQAERARRREDGDPIPPCLEEDT